MLLPKVHFSVTAKEGISSCCNYRKNTTPKAVTHTYCTTKNSHLANKQNGSTNTQKAHLSGHWKFNYPAWRFPRTRQGQGGERPSQRPPAVQFLGIWDLKHLILVSDFDPEFPTFFLSIFQTHSSFHIMHYINSNHKPAWEYYWSEHGTGATWRYLEASRLGSRQCPCFLSSALIYTQFTKRKGISWTSSTFWILPADNTKKERWLLELLGVFRICSKCWMNL